MARRVGKRCIAMEEGCLDEELVGAAVLTENTSSPFGNRLQEFRRRLQAEPEVTGVTFTGTDLPRSDYELRLEARRLDGTDFFCGLTFPVGERHLTLIVGGWGGAVVGLSSLDGEDASANETRRTMSFRKGEWYPIRLRVARERVSVWINGEQVIDQSLVGRELSLRYTIPLDKLGIKDLGTYRLGVRLEPHRRSDRGEKAVAGKDFSKIWLGGLDQFFVPLVVE